MNDAQVVEPQDNIFVKVLFVVVDEHLLIQHEDHY
jgi:hypothetical protein